MQRVTAARLYVSTAKGLSCIGWYNKRSDINKEINTAMPFICCLALGFLDRNSDFPSPIQKGWKGKSE